MCSCVLINHSFHISCNLEDISAHRRNVYSHFSFHYISILAPIAPFIGRVFFGSNWKNILVKFQKINIEKWVGISGPVLLVDTMHKEQSIPAAAYQ